MIRKHCKTSVLKNWFSRRRKTFLFKEKAKKILTTYHFLFTWSEKPFQEIVGIQNRKKQRTKKQRETKKSLTKFSFNLCMFEISFNCHWVIRSINFLMFLRFFFSIVFKWTSGFCFFVLLAALHIEKFNSINQFVHSDWSSIIIRELKILKLNAIYFLRSKFIWKEID